MPSKQATEDPRIRALHERVWIGYGRAIEIRTQLQDLLEHPKTHRMPNLAIVGETNNGKTMLVQNFVRRSNPPIDPAQPKSELPVLLVESPPDPDEARIYNAILAALWAGGASREPVDAKFQRVRLILTELKTKMLIIDEFQHALSGTPIRQRKFLTALKYLGNELQIPIVLSGTLEGLNALQSDPQIANRFEPCFLPKWKFDSDFLRLMMSIEKTLGLKGVPSLAEERIANRILDESEGTIGEIMRLVRLLAINAIKTGEEMIADGHLSDSSLKKLGWRRPSARTRAP